MISYALIGFDATHLKAELGSTWYDFTEELCDSFVILDGLEDGLNKDQIVIGERVVTIMDSYVCAGKSFTMHELVIKQQEIAERLLPFVQEYPADITFRLYIGTQQD